MEGLLDEVAEGINQWRAPSQFIETLHNSQPTLYVLAGGVRSCQCQ
jgi:hypothetical protein